MNRPNILFFQCDDLEHSDFGALGNKVVTPHIDRVMREGMTFDRAYCPAALCTPSRYEYLTGRYASACNGRNFLSQNPAGQPARIFFNTDVDGESPTMGSLLAEAGYRTGYFGKWHTGGKMYQDLPECLTRDASLEDPEVDHALRDLQAKTVAHVKAVSGYTDVGAISFDNKEQFPVFDAAYHWTEWMVEHAVEMIRDCGPDQPFFVHLATSAPHGRVHAAEQVRPTHYTMGGKLDHEPIGSEKRHALVERCAELGFGPEDRALIMMHLDDQLGTLLAELERKGVYENTLIVVSCDHSLEPGKGSCYQPGIHIPMCASWPGTIEPGSRTDEIILNVDWMPTFVHAAGGDIPEDCRVDGQDLKPFFTEGTSLKREEVFLNIGYQRGIYDGRYKLILTRFPDEVLQEMQDGTRDQAPNHQDQVNAGQPYVSMECYPHYFDPDQLYDHQYDPDEQVNLVDDPAYAEIYQRLRKILQRYLESIPDHPVDIEIPPYMLTDHYKSLAAKTQAIGTSHLNWWSPEYWTARPPCFPKRT